MYIDLGIIDLWDFSVLIEGFFVTLTLYPIVSVYPKAAKFTVIPQKDGDIHE